jgi:hypothetical protein
MSSTAFGPVLHFQKKESSLWDASVRFSLGTGSRFMTTDLEVFFASFLRVVYIYGDCIAWERGMTKALYMRNCFKKKGVLGMAI